MKLTCPLTLQIWFFASEVSHHSLQLTQLTMGRVNVGLAVGPTSNTQTKMYCSHVFKKSYKQQHWWEIRFIRSAFYTGTVFTIRWLMSGLEPVSHGDLKKKEEKKNMRERE